MADGRRRVGRGGWAAALVLAGAVAALASGCSIAGDASGAHREPAPLRPIAGLADRPLRVTTTTNFITDLARQIGGDRVEVTGLLGPGVDPHLYKASAGDVRRIARADLVLYGGLHLEGKMAELFEEIAERQPALAVTVDFPREELLAIPGTTDEVDPHVWFDVALWQRAARTVAEAYQALDPANAAYYRERLDAYARELAATDDAIRGLVAEVPEASRILVTSHDAFHYFGRRYGFQVEGIQGVSTATQATTADIDRIARLLVERRVKAVFVESSVPRQTIEAVLAAAASRGWQVRVGGELFADSAGSPGTPEETYVGMVRANADTIVEALR
ncbi:MAG: zinc ABC transporter substrate-binding protein [Thermoleophilia bacterium]